MKSEPQLDWIAPASLRVFEGNPVVHPANQVEQIARSMKEFGFMAPILADENNVILAGHGRQMAALELGLAKVPVVRSESLTPAQKRAYMLADNKIAANADFDSEKLSAELKALLGASFDLSLTGFQDYELDPLLQAVWTNREPVKHEVSTHAIVFSAEQWKTVGKAIEKMRERTGGDESVTDSACMIGIVEQRLAAWKRPRQRMKGGPATEHHRKEVSARAARMKRR